MIHHLRIEEGHYGVSISANGLNVLVQVQNRWAEQARQALTVEEAEHMANLILYYAEEIRKGAKNK